MNNENNEQFEMIRYTWQSFNGVRSCKLIPREVYEQPESEQHLSHALGCVFIPTFIDTIPKDVAFEDKFGTLKVTPCKETLRPVPWTKNQGMVFSKFTYEDNREFEGCPRTLLQKAIDDLKQMGFDLKIGIELEFQLFKVNREKQTLEPVEEEHWHNANSIDQFSEDFIIINQYAKQMGVSVEMIHKEGGDGQFELVLKYDDVMTTLDNYHRVKEAISHHFRQKNILACFLPKVGTFGNGCHIHMSLWKDGVNITDDSNSSIGLSQESENFFAGVLNNFNALFHFLNPSPNSIKRVVPSHWAGAYRFWAHNNKEAPMRYCRSTKKNGKSSNIEIKSFDHTCNHYFAMAALIALGMKGLREEQRLPEPFKDDPGSLTKQQRERIGIEQLPMTYEERKQAIYSEEGKELNEYFGEKVIKSVLAMHDCDHEFFKDKSLEEMVWALKGRY